ncbi:MAG TPA: LysM peptidoglycan-binding domain-containing protein [Anaerolineae bacterium]|nr:LysM peptidoglycan-binding domain-containing protein [Anaerolineae bacterium]HQH39325.1 LysM peptidoglycan-binding domain-containing protein [Anaerolineae bacterium]
MKKSTLRIILLGSLFLLWVAALSACRHEVSLGEDARLLRSTSTPQPALLTATARAVGTATPTVRVNTSTPTPTRVAPDSTVVYYTVRSGDTLSAIAAAFGTTVEALMHINAVVDADRLSAGQVLQISLEAQYTGPGTLLIPDSELVYGPAYKDFDIAQATAAFAGRFKDYSEDVEGVTMTAPEIVQLVAERYSVGPRVLLTLLELRSGWLTGVDQSAEQLTYPLGYEDISYQDGLFSQLSLAADALNTGFYGWWMDTLWLVRTRDGTYIQFSTHLNAGTAGVQRALAPSAVDYEGWLADLSRFTSVYRQLFGDPFALAVEPLLPDPMETPELALPWSAGQVWYYTGGPHPGYGTQGAFSALDFTTGERNIGCAVSSQWATAAADGLVIHSREGLVLQDLDGDGFAGTGWVLLYLHLASDGRVQTGAMLKTGDQIGHPSCEGGVSNAAHLHLARRYNGVWMAADDPRWPMVLSGWMPASTGEAYDGTLSAGGQTRTACECWEATINGILR